MNRQLNACCALALVLPLAWSMPVSADETVTATEDAEPLNVRQPAWPEDFDLDEPVEADLAVEISPFGNVIDVQMTPDLPQIVVEFLAVHAVSWQFRPPRGEHQQLSQRKITRFHFDPDEREIRMDDFELMETRVAPDPTATCDEWIEMNIPILSGSLPEAYLTGDRVAEARNPEWPEGVHPSRLGLVVMLVPPEAYEVDEDGYLTPERDRIEVTWAEPSDIFVEAARDALSEWRIDGGDAPEETASQPFCQPIRFMPQTPQAGPEADD